MNDHPSTATADVDQADEQPTTITAGQDRSGANLGTRADIDDDQADADVSSQDRTKITADQVRARAGLVLTRARAECGHVAQGWRSLHDTNQDQGEDSGRTRGIVTSSYVVGNALVIADLLYGLGEPIPQLPGLLGWITTATITADVIGLAWLRHLGTRADTDDDQDNLRADTKDQAVTDADDPATWLTALLREVDVLKRKQRVDTATVDERGDRTVIDLVLSKGCRYQQLTQARDTVASALDVQPQQISITPSDGRLRSPRRCRMTVHTDLPLSGEPTRNPLVARIDALDVARDGLPVAADVDGGTVALNLVDGRHVLAAASSGNGKTLGWLRSILAALGLDPRARLSIVDGKGAGGLRAWRDAAEDYITAADNGWLFSVTVMLEGVTAELDRRAATLAAGGRLTDRRFLVLDELSRIVGDSNTAYEDVEKDLYGRIRTALDQIYRQGRELGVHIIACGQELDGRYLMSAWVGGSGVVICGYVDDDTAKKLLGKLVARTGLPSEVIVDGDQAGTAIIVAPGYRPSVLARAWFVDDTDAEVLGRRAAQLRTGDVDQAADDSTAEKNEAPAGNAAEDAAGEQDTDPRAQLIAALGRWLDDRPDTSGTVRTSVLLAELDGPAAEWSPRRFGDELAALDVPKIDGRYPTRDVTAIRTAVRRARLKAV